MMLQLLSSIIFCFLFFSGFSRFIFFHGKTNQWQGSFASPDQTVCFSAKKTTKQNVSPNASLCLSCFEEDDLGDGGVASEAAGEPK